MLVRLGIYIGTHFFSNSKIDILSDCNADIDPSDRTITKDPPVVFRNCEFSMVYVHMLCMMMSGVGGL